MIRNRKAEFQLALGDAERVSTSMAMLCACAHTGDVSGSPLSIHDRKRAHSNTRDDYVKVLTKHPDRSWRPKVRSHWSIHRDQTYPRLFNKSTQDHLRIYISTIRSMCTVQFWKSKQCGHQWLTIKKPCKPSRGFDDCPSFQTRRARVPGGPGFWASKGSCPWHDKKGEYDANLTRVVDKVTHGVRVGLGPSRSAAGLDVGCCMIM